MAHNIETSTEGMTLYDTGWKYKVMYNNEN